MMRRERGVAIVLAMGVVAMAAIAAVALMVLQSTWTRQQELRTDHARAIAVVQGGIDWARAILNEDRRTSSVDHLGVPWALRLAPIPIENGEAVEYGTHADLIGRDGTYRNFFAAQFGEAAPGFKEPAAVR